MRPRRGAAGARSARQRARVRADARELRWRLALRKEAHPPAVVPTPRGAWSTFERRVDITVILVAAALGMRALAAYAAEGTGCARDASEFAEAARRAARSVSRSPPADDDGASAAAPVEATAPPVAPAVRPVGAAGRTYARQQQSAPSRRRQARARTTHARRTRRRIVRACASRGLRALLRTEGWGTPREGRVTLATYNVSGRFGRSSWRPFEDGLPARIQNMIAVLTHTDGDNSGACGLQHRSEGNKRIAAGGGVRIIHSDLFAARRVDIATLARDAGVGEFKDIVAVTLTLGRTTITVIGIYIPPPAFGGAGPRGRGRLAGRHRKHRLRDQRGP